MGFLLRAVFLLHPRTRRFRRVRQRILQRFFEVLVSDLKVVLHCYGFAVADPRTDDVAGISTEVGPMATVAALEVQIVAARKAAARAAFDAFTKEYEAANELLRESHHLVKQLVSAEMIQAGYHRRDRGRWRKRR